MCMHPGLVCCVLIYMTLYYLITKIVKGLKGVPSQLHRKEVHHHPGDSSKQAVCVLSYH